jgi:hypothetical protein
VLATRLLSHTARIDAENPAHGNGDVVFTVSGRLEAHHISELSALLAAEPGGRPRVLDLKDLVLVDGDVVRFLRTCDADSIVLRNCPPYIRAWMEREGERS